MALHLHTIKPTPGSTKDRKRVGRGGKRGTYSGRGLKGQRARSGGKAGTLRRGLKQLVERTHKLSGFKSIHPKPYIVSLDALERRFEDGDKVNPSTLLKKGLIQNTERKVKILSNGDLKKKLVVENCLASESAKKIIEKAGGSIVDSVVEKSNEKAQTEEKKPASKEGEK